MKAYKYKLKVSKAVEVKFIATLDICRELYNAGLQERRDAYKMCGVSLNAYDQMNQLPELKKIRTDMAEANAQVLQDVLKRLQKAFDGFFRRIKAGEKAGYPRFKGQDRYDSFTYPQMKGGFRIEGDKLYLSKIGSCRVRLSRPIEGTIKTCSIKREVDGWYVMFIVEENQNRFIPKTGEAVGIDVGLENFATLSTGEIIENPKFLRAAERRLKTAHRSVSRKKKGGANRKKAVRLLARQYAKVKRQRQDFFHKVSLQLLRRFDVIAVEDLNIKGMVKNHHLAKSISDASWGTFMNILECKAAEAGKRVERVPAAYTSQDCSSCGARVRKTLATRKHQCASCGLELHRDHNAAINIQHKAGTPPIGIGLVTALSEL